MTTGEYPGQLGGLDRGKGYPSDVLDLRSDHVIVLSCNVIIRILSMTALQNMEQILS